MQQITRKTVKKGQPTRMPEHAQYLGFKDKDDQVELIFVALTGVDSFQVFMVLDLGTETSFPDGYEPLLFHPDKVLVIRN